MWRSNRKALRWEELRARGATAQEIDAALIRVDDVDERQRAVLDRAYRYAYWILAAVGGAVLLYGITGNGLIPKDLRLGLFFTVVVTLPTAFVAWSEPDPPDET